MDPIGIPIDILPSSSSSPYSWYLEPEVESRYLIGNWELGPKYIEKTGRLG